MPSQRHFNIISFDGGGVRGAAQIEIISRIIEEKPSLIRDTDLLVGVSFSGLLALLLAAGKNSAQVRNFFLQILEEAFQVVENSNGKPYYSIDKLKSLLESQFGKMTLAELDKRIMIVAFDLGSNSKNCKPKVFHNLPNSDADLADLVVDVALCTCATPSKFLPYKGFIDGCVVAANPSMMAITQAMGPQTPFKNLNTVNLLSVGVDRMGRRFLGKHPGWEKSDPINLFFEAGINVVHTECERLLGNKYHRVGINLDKVVELDEWESLPFILETSQKEKISTCVHWLDNYWL